MAFSLYPSNDLALTATLKTVDPATQQVTNLTSGTVTAFLSTTNGPTATAADSTLVTTCTYSTRTQKWLIAFDGSVLAPGLLASLFAATPTACYCIVTANSTDIRAYIALTYVAPRAAVQ